MTFLNASDNLTLKWFYNKVMKLPIKLGTLDFHKMVDPLKLQKYGVILPTEIAQGSIERSYEITSSFILNASNRLEYRLLELKK